jgi:prepilin-type processing-associated H-X9-DG protein
MTGGCTQSASAFKPSDVFDGVSNTLMLAEVIQGHGGDHRGFTWWSDSAGFQTQQSPNSAAPDVMNGGTCVNTTVNRLNPPCVLEETATAPQRRAARSRHPGGVQVAMLDGAVRFISDNININTWRALSTMAGKDTLPDSY